MKLAYILVWTCVSAVNYCKTQQLDTRKAIKAMEQVTCLQKQHSINTGNTHGFQTTIPRFENSNLCLQ